MNNNHAYDVEHISFSALIVMQNAVRKWSDLLTPSEFMVVMQLIDRTIGWQKTRVAISTERMREGDSVYGGMNIGKTAFFAALASLEEKGVIARHAHPEGKRIKLFSVNLGWSPAVLNVPKRLKDGSPNELSGFAKRTMTVRNANARERSQGERSQEKEDDTDHRPSADDTAIVGDDDVIRAAKAAVVARRRRPPRQLTSLVQIVDAAQREWRRALEESHPTGEFSGWSVREIAKVKAKAKRWTGRKIAFHDFIGWCAANWAGVCRVQLNWMTKSPPPKAPSIGFLISFIEHFEEAWASKALDDWMHADQRNQYERLVAKGLSHDEAIFEMAKSDAIDATRDEVRKAKHEIKIEQGVLRREKEALRNQMIPAPVHPRSRLAERERRATRGPLLEPTKITSEEDLAKIDLMKLPQLDPNWEPESAF